MIITLPKIFNWGKPETEKRAGTVSSLSFGALTSSSTSLYSEAMQLSTVYRCIDVISDAVAALPFEPFKSGKDGMKQAAEDHITYDLLNVQPNRIQSRFTFIKLLITDTLLQGNGFAYIERDVNNNAVRLQYLASSTVSIWISQDKRFVSYKHPDIKGIISSENMIHILNFTFDGMRGISTLTHAALATSTARATELHAKGFFTGGANVSGILSSVGGLETGQADAIKSKWKANTDPVTGNPNGIIVIEGADLKFNPVGIDPDKAQMLESRQFSVVEICRFFGVSPVKAFSEKATTYSNIEQSNLSFLTDTLSPLIEKIENEFNRKLFRPSERKKYSVQFDVTSLLRADLAAQSEYYSKMFNIGVFTSNDIRKKLNMQPIEGGDVAFVQGALLPITFDFNAKNQIDNKQKSPNNPKIPNDKKL